MILRAEGQRVYNSTTVHYRTRDSIAEALVLVLAITLR